MIKVNTIGALFRKSKARFGKDKMVPYIRLSGLWLKHLGFDIGKDYQVHFKENEILLKVIPDKTEKLNGE
jgi:hypothetical protein